MATIEVSWNTLERMVNVNLERMLAITFYGASGTLSLVRKTLDLLVQTCHRHSSDLCHFHCHSSDLCHHHHHSSNLRHRHHHSSDLCRRHHNSSQLHRRNDHSQLRCHQRRQLHSPRRQHHNRRDQYRRKRRQLHHNLRELSYRKKNITSSLFKTLQETQTCSSIITDEHTFITYEYTLYSSVNR
jgi:hypothetical protein